VYWTVWIQWPGTSEPQEYKALVDTGAQCTLMPSSYRGTELIYISGVTGGSQELSVLEEERSLTGKDWQKHPMVAGGPMHTQYRLSQKGAFQGSQGILMGFWNSCRRYRQH